jgi:hypothetical protein
MSGLSPDGVGLRLRTLKPKCLPDPPRPSRLRRLQNPVRPNGCLAREAVDGSSGIQQSLVEVPQRKYLGMRALSDSTKGYKILP